jgi:C-terminal processing protease CtpA/Prc
VGVIRPFVSWNSFIFFGLAVWLIAGCSPAPRHKLTEDEKKADMAWLFTEIEENYAPLAYKADSLKFDWKELKKRYLTKAIEAADNEAFYLVAEQLIAEFHDGHMSLLQISSSLPHRTRIAYLGFDGIRKGNDFLVKKLLPTIAKDSGYPIKVDDVIVKLDGVPLVDLVNKELVPQRNVGQANSNLTYLMPKLFTRYSISSPLPTNPDALVTVRRKDTDVVVKMPWIVKDLYHFTEEQSRAAKTRETAETTAEEEKFGLLTPAAFFGIGLQVLNQTRELKPALARAISRQQAGFDVRNGFVFYDETPTWGSKMLSQLMATALDQPEPTIDEFKRERSVPADALFLNQAATFPTYLWAEKILDKDKKATGQVRPIAYTYLNTFSPSADEKAVLKEVKEMLKTIQGFGVKDLIIDLVDNGGGSLSLGLQLANLFSEKALVLPEIQMKLSETWIDEFESKSLSGPSDAHKELARRVFEGLLQDKDKNLPLSRKWGMEALLPFTFEPNADLNSGLNVYLLVNEMCASMCDIFSAIFKDNRLGTIIGAKTMGAGGNVVLHRESPSSHFMLNTTESLMVRRDGSYLENNGVEPDVAFDVVGSVGDKYTPLKKKAVELIMERKN